MTDQQTTTAAPDTEQREKVTRRDLVEGQIEKVLGKADLVPVGHFSLKFENALQIAEAAKLMSTAGPILPVWLQGNPGGCWSIIVRSLELGISPLALADWSYVTENKGVKRVGFMSGFYHAIVEMRAPIKERMRFEIIGEGDDRKCRVWATFKGETEPRDLTSEPLGKLRPDKNEYGKTKGSPLWDRKPDIQMFYDTVRDWARIYCPDILAGLKGDDELGDAAPEFGPARARDVTPRADDLRLRLGAGRTAAERRDELGEYLNQAFDQTATMAEGAAGPGVAASGAGVIEPGKEDAPAPSDQPPHTPSAADDGGDVPGRTSASPPETAEAAPPTQPESFAEQVQRAVDPIEVAKRRGREGFRSGKRRRECPEEYRTPGRGAEALAYTEGWDLEQADSRKDQK